jgi:bifunctional non-homologous end joining protein LigD
VSVIHFGPYRVKITNSNKVLFPGAGISKGDLIHYYCEIAAVMLPHLRDRPLTLQRFPDGIAAKGFYQQEMSDYFPGWIHSCRAERVDARDSRTVNHILCNNRASLAYLANQATISLHGWLARAPSLHSPDRLIFDLDPPDHDFAAVRRAARWVVKLMQLLRMTPFVMTTGSRGLHVVAPLRSQAGFDQVRDLARSMADYLVRQHPDTLTVEQRKTRRLGRVYLDVMRNAYGQTGVMPYSVRALADAPVATPLDLAELDDRKLDPRRWHLRNVLRRLGQRPDPWADIRRHACSPEKVRESLRLIEKN